MMPLLRHREVHIMLTIQVSNGPLHDQEELAVTVHTLA